MNKCCNLCNYFQNKITAYLVNNKELDNMSMDIFTIGYPFYKLFIRKEAGSNKYRIIGQWANNSVDKFMDFSTRHCPNCECLLLPNYQHLLSDYEEQTPTIQQLEELLGEEYNLYDEQQIQQYFYNTWCN